MFKKNHLSLVLVSLLFFLCVASCSFDDSKRQTRLKLYLDPQSRQKELQRLSESTSLSLPSTASGFDCYILNVVSDDIDSRPASVSSFFPSSNLSLLRAGQGCTYPGISSSFLTTDSEGRLTFELSVPAGEDRIFQLLGVVGFDNCPNTRLGETMAQSLAAGEDLAESFRGLYELGRIERNVFPDNGNSLSLDLAVTYDPENPLQSNCLAEPLEYTPPSPPTQTVGTGAFTFAGTLSGFVASSEPMDFAVGDFRGTNQDDLIIVSTKRRLRLYPKTSTGWDSTTAIDFIMTGGTGSNWIEAFDHDNDGDKDLWVGSDDNRSELFEWDAGSGTMISTATLNYESMGPQMGVGDFNNDGREDVGLLRETTDSDYSVQLSNGDGTFTDSLNLTFGGGPIVISEALDFDGDGDVDIVGIDSSNMIIFFENQGTGTFETPVTSLFGTGSSTFSSMAVADIDGDGLLDILASDETDGLVRMALGSGSGLFLTSTTFDPSDEARALAVKDLNNDNAPDLVVAGVNTIRVYLNDGEGSWSLSQSFTHGVGSPQKIGLGDMNGDGARDLLVLGDSPNKNNQIKYYFQNTEEISL